jgi:hypothetical protein
MSIRKKLDLDAKFSATGDRRYLSPAEIARLKKSRLSLSRELSRHETQESLLDSEIASGAVEAARARIDAIRSAADGEEIPEIHARIQAARLEGARANWSEVASICHRLIACDVPGIWRLTVHQLLANALFESGDVEASLFAIEQASGLRELYPHAPVADFLVSNEAKGLAALGRVEEARARLDAWVNGLAEITLDQALTLARTESYIALFASDSGAAAANASLAAYEIAGAIGDSLYAGLALAELYLIEGGLPEPLSRELGTLTARYERIERFLAADGSAGYHTANGYLRHESTGRRPDYARAGTIFFPRHRLKVVLVAGTCERYDELSDQEERILQTVVESREQTKEEFFRKVWALRFDKDRHKTTLTMALTRFRRRLDVEIRLSGGLITANSLRLV